MRLSIPERIEIVLLYGRQGWSENQTADEFNRLHPERQDPLARTTVGRIMKKFKETGSVHDASRSGRPKTDDDTQEVILAKVSSNPTKSLKRHSKELAIPYGTCHRTLKAHKFHPYKLKILHRLYDDDFERRMKMCEWFLGNIFEDRDFLKKILFTDEANFYVNGEVDQMNIRYWSNENPHFYRGSNEQGGQRLMVWLGVWDELLIGPFFFAGTVTGEVYLKMLGDEMIPQLDALGRRPAFFQQDGAPPHYAQQVRHWLNQEFPESWIGRGGPVEWAPRSPDLNPLDFCIWGYLKSKVYSERIRDLAHLRTRIEEECLNIQGQMLHNVNKNLEKRLEACMNEGGMHFEQLL